MTKNIIAEIELCPGEVGYYDDYSRIRLSVYNRRAVVYAGTNCTQIKRSIKSGRLRLITGSLAGETPVDKNYLKTLKAEKELEKIKAEQEHKETEAKLKEKAKIEEEQRILEKAKAEEEQKAKEHKKEEKSEETTEQKMQELSNENEIINLSEEVNTKQEEEKTEEKKVSKRGRKSANSDK